MAAKNFVIYGDQLASGADGIGEVLFSKILSNQPQNHYNFSLSSTENLSWSDAFKWASKDLIGKAPELLIVTNGTFDIEAKKPLNEIQIRLIVLNNKLSSGIAALCAKFIIRGG